MRKVLLDIYYTTDLVADDDALTCEELEQVLHDYIIRLTKGFHENGDYIAFLIDIHFENNRLHPKKVFYFHHIMLSEH